MAFSTTFGHYEFNRAPMGLKTSPSVHQRLMDRVLKYVKGKICFVYMDDIIIFSETPEQHYERLQIVLDLLRQADLMAKYSKCRFMQTTISYLGHTFTQGKIQPGGNKVKAVQHFPCPQNVKGVQSFLGLVNFYRRFIPNCSEISGPLLHLLGKQIPFKWTSEFDEAFKKLKEALTSTPVLIMPDFKENAPKVED